MRKECCEWQEDSNGLWDTDCGHIFEIYDGAPSDNGMKFCCYCGRELREVKYEEESDET